MIKVTFKQIREFNMAAESFMRRAPSNEFTKLGYAVNKISENELKSILKDYNKEFQDASYEHVQKVQVNLALTDKDTGAVLTTPKGSARPYLYDKKGLLDIMKAERDFGAIAEGILEEWDSKEFEISEHIVPELPKDLKINEIEGMKNFTIDSKAAEELMEKLGGTTQVETPKAEAVEPAA